MVLFCFALLCIVVFGIGNIGGRKGGYLSVLSHCDGWGGGSFERGRKEGKEGGGNCVCVIN